MGCLHRIYHTLLACLSVSLSPRANPVHRFTWWWMSPRRTQRSVLPSQRRYSGYVPNHHCVLCMLSCTVHIHPAAAAVGVVVVGWGVLLFWNQGNVRNSCTAKDHVHLILSYLLALNGTRHPRTTDRHHIKELIFHAPRRYSRAKARRSGAPNSFSGPHSERTLLSVHGHMKKYPCGVPASATHSGRDWLLCLIFSSKQINK